MLQHRAGESGPPGTQADRGRSDRGQSDRGLGAEGGCGEEHGLTEAVRRAARAPHGRMALALHLSRLPAPGPRPHHRRVARAILDDAARRHEGQLFVLTNGDLVLLCRSARPGHAAAAPDPAALPDTLARLLRMDMPDPGRLTTVWKLDEALPALAAFAAERLAEGGRTMIAAPAPGPGLAMQTGVVHALAAIAEGPATADLLRRQTGVLVAAHPPGGPLLRPLFQEVTFSIAALEARIAAGGQAGADPFLFRHLAGRLDRRMLARLTEAAGTGGVLDIAAGAYGTAPLHINLTLPVILSDAFARFARLCRDSAAPLGVEVTLVEACDDAAAFGRARRALAESGLTLVLDGVSHLALVLARPCALRPDLVKLDWSPRLGALAGEEQQQVAATLDRLGAHRVVLHRAETEAALRWGMANGIRRFQGRHVDAMLAGARMAACPRAAGCTLRQCGERAAATGPAGRAGCGAVGLLDGAAAPAASGVRRPGPRDERRCPAPARPGGRFAARRGGKPARPGARMRQRRHSPPGAAAAAVAGARGTGAPAPPAAGARGA